MLPRRRGPLAARLPADTRSPIGTCQLPEHITGRPRAGRISSIRRKSLLGETQVRFRHRELSGSLRDTIPERLQIADLLGLRERSEPCRISDGGARRSPFAFSRFGGHGLSLFSRVSSRQCARWDTEFWLAPVAMARNLGFTAVELRRVQRLVVEHVPGLLEAWNEYFGGSPGRACEGCPVYRGHHSYGIHASYRRPLSSAPTGVWPGEASVSTGLMSMKI